MSTLEDARGVREIYLRRAWRIREEGRFGYITLEQEGRASSYNIYLIVGREWKRLAFKRCEVLTRIYSGATAGIIVEVAIERNSSQAQLQMFVRNRDVGREWVICWRADGRRLLLTTVRTMVDPYVVVV
jgi:hypothetical protein